MDVSRAKHLTRLPHQNAPFGAFGKLQGSGRRLGLKRRL
jgi:hypothetical protein